jgi:hypothetical protein
MTTTGTGDVAGSVEGMPFFCAALHDVLVASRLPPSVRIVAFADDVSIVGAPSEVHAVVGPLGDALRDKLNLNLQPHKSRWASHRDADAAMRAIDSAIPRGEVPDVAPGAQAAAPPLAGIVYAGVPLGERAFVRQELEHKYVAMERDIRTIHSKLGPDNLQQQWLMLFKSSQYRLDYLLAHCLPEDTEDVARRFDALLASLAGELLGSDIAGAPFGTERLRLPLRHGGLGLRSRADMRDSAFTGAAAKALPALADCVPDAATARVRPGVLSTARIAGVIGQGSFDGGAYDLSSFFSAGTRTGDAVQRSWQAMQQRAATTGCSAPGHGALAADFSNMGYGIHNLQNATTTQLDAVRFAELKTSVPPQTRAHAAIFAADPLSRAFLSCLPVHERLRPQDFRECFARFLAAPSPACAPFVGQRLHVAGSAGGGVVDRYGDGLVSAATTGDHVTRFRHDPLVDQLTTAARNAGCYARQEDSSFFRSAILQAALDAMGARAGTARHSRVPVPDITLQHNAARGLELVEVKTISFCETWYPSCASGGVARRERTLAAEYLRKARALDRAFGLAQAGAGTANVTVGPIEAKYLSVGPVRGAVVGGFGEGSAGLYGLIADISAAAGRKLHSRLGLCEAMAASHAKRLLISRIGTMMARGHAQLVAARLQFVAPLTAQRACGRARARDVFSMRSLEVALMARGAGGRSFGGVGAG